MQKRNTLVRELREVRVGENDRIFYYVFWLPSGSHTPIARLASHNWSMGPGGPLNMAVLILRVPAVTVSGIYTARREYYQEHGNMHVSRFGWGLYP